MRRLKRLKPSGRVIAHHFSHIDNPLHEELEAFLTPKVGVTYDRLEIEL